MEIQSLSIAVPAGCMNKCKFCVSEMHENSYPNLIGNRVIPGDLEISEEYKKYLEYRKLEDQYKKRMQFARDNGCNTMMITGSGEPLMNKEFLYDLSKWNNSIKSPFHWIELQTSGVDLNEKDCWCLLRDTVGVSTISLSLSNMFDSNNNAQINGTPDGHIVNIEKTCKMIKEYGMNLRLSLNMTDVYNSFSAEQIFSYAKTWLGADQITFRELYQSGDPLLKQNQWIAEHACDYSKLYEIQQYIKTHGSMLEQLPFGANKYSVDGMSVVVDDDCMSKEANKALKYLVLRPNCKLYSRWDDKGSLFF